MQTQLFIFAKTTHAYQMWFDFTLNWLADGYESVEKSAL